MFILLNIIAQIGNVDPVEKAGRVPLDLLTRKGLNKINVVGQSGGSRCAGTDPITIVLNQGRLKSVYVAQVGL